MPDSWSYNDLFDRGSGLGQKALTKDLVLPLDTLDIDSRNIFLREQHRLLADKWRSVQDMRRRSQRRGDNRIRIGQIFAMFLDQNVRDVTQDLLPDAVMETGHDGKHDDQCSDAKRDTGDRDERDHRDKRLFALGPKVAQADKKFVVHKNPGSARRGAQQRTSAIKGPEPDTSFFVTRHLFRLRAQLREEDNISNRLGVGQQHHQAVNANTLSCCRRQAVFQGADIILVHGVSLFITRLFLHQLLDETFTLIIRVVQLGESVRQLTTNDKELKTIDNARVVIVLARQAARLQSDTG